MKKHLLLTILIVAISFTSRAQYVPIPDAAFVTWLQGHGFSAAISGSQLDTSNNLVLTTTTLSCNAVPIRNLAGIQYFKALTNLDCSNDSLYVIPALPPVLLYFNCQYNNLDSLPTLPAGIKTANAANNHLLYLRALPASINDLNVPYNNLTGLPALPSSLTMLNCQSNQITALPSLPASLADLNCGFNKITSLPALPATLAQLNCNNNLLTALPALNPPLNLLDCSSNALFTLPALPSTLINLTCTSDSLSALPALPAAMVDLACQNNLLTSLPALPVSLNNLTCGVNRLTIIPSLPVHLATLSCDYTQITGLPDLPATLTYLSCGRCPITSLPVLPDSLYNLNLQYDSNLTCLPQLKRIVYLYFNGTGVTCLPDYGHVTSSTPALNTIPLCGIYSPTGCPVFWNISGATFFDRNGDCAMDSTDAPLPNIKVQLDSANVLVQQVVTNTDGLFSFLTTKNHIYKVTVDTATNLGLRVTCPGNNIHLDTLTLADSLSYNNNFAMQCRGFDVGVQSVLSTGLPRPGTHIQLNTIAGDLTALYGGHCAAGHSGQVQLTFSGPVTYGGPAPGALPVTSITGNTITWAIADYGTVNPLTAFNLLFVIDSTATGGATVCISANVTPFLNDANQANNNFNYCFPVLNSLDPNEKDAYPIRTMGLNEQWLTYTIRFQNTGNAPALNIAIVDTLSTNVDPSTFQLLASSAKNLTQLFGNRVVFNFPNINLPDSAANPVGSTGYLQYKVKLKTGLAAGAIINNRASIYFDLNNPLRTNNIADTIVHCTPNGSTYARTICQGDIIGFQGSFLDSTGIYTDTLTNVGGCDSVVTLNLIVNALTYDTIHKTLCTGDTFYLDSTHAYGRYGTYYDTVLNALGCDSFITVFIIVSQVSFDTIAEYVCAGDSVHFGNGLYGAAGVYNDTVFNSGGCPISITTLYLNVHPLPVVTFTLDSLQAAGDVRIFSGGQGEGWCMDENPLNFTLTGGSPTGGHYTGNFIAGNIFHGDSLGFFNSQFDAITYTYTDSNGCKAKATDSIYLSNFCDGITVIPGANLFTLYPNPADDYAMIDFNANNTGATILVKDITGRQLYNTRLTTGPQQIATGNLPPGVYLVTMYKNGEVGTRLLVKE